MGTLYLVATPIGNLEDLTRRAVNVLGHVAIIAAEDTRHTSKLLAHYHISTKMISYYEHNKISRLEEILGALSEGDVALVSDAGTPGLNDPGYELIKAAMVAGHQVSPIPGPCAPIAALISSGIPTDKFLYLGYLPRKSIERRKSLAQVHNLPFTLVFLETPHRLLAALQDLLNELGDRKIAVARELTKLHEEIFHGNLSEAISHFSPQPVRGEITLIVAGNAYQEEWEVEQLRSNIQFRLSNGEPPTQIASVLTSQSGWTRRNIYRLITEIQASENDPFIQQ